MAAEILDVRPLVIGASGLVGSALTAQLEENFPHTVSATRTELDIADRWRTEAELQRLDPTVVVNCAAMSDVDRCEAEPELAHRNNVDGPANLALACRNIGARLIHLSTDYVFDGTLGGEYAEDDAPNPVNEYGRSKLLGEMAVLEQLVDAVVLRVSFVFGPGRVTFIDKVVERAKGETGPLPIVDSWGNKPTHTAEIVRGIEQLLLDRDATGVWHLAGGPPVVTRYAFAREVLRMIGDDPGRVEPVDASTLKLAAKRPGHTPLSTRRFDERFGAVRPWTEWAREYLAGKGWLR